MDSEFEKRAGFRRRRFLRLGGLGFCVVTLGLLVFTPQS